jgi:flagellar biosynthesis anti-sigma factor FlgM
MKVDLNGADPSILENVSSTQHSFPTKAGATIEASFTADDDAATLSLQGDRVKAMVTKALEANQVRLEKVEALRQAVQNGEYKLDPASIADAMIRSFAPAE